MGIADIYYNLEDKWYDLLDFLESKRIPVYKVVDPVENAGIPTLPVFVALLLLAGYLIIPGIGGPAAPRTIEITLEISANGTLQPGTGVTAYSDSRFLDAKSTDQEGKVVLRVLPGAVTLVLKKEGCTDKNETITVSEKRTIQLNLTCQGGAAPGYVEITVLDQDGNPLREGRVTLLDADGNTIQRYNVTGGLLRIPSGVQYSRLSLLSDCAKTEVSRADLTLRPLITVDCATDGNTTRLAQQVSLTVYTYYSGAKVSNIPVYLEDDGGNAFTQHQPTSGGSTTFSVDKDKGFKIRTDATSLYKTYSSDRIVLTAGSSRDVSLVKGTAVSTINVSDNSTKKPLTGAHVTVLDGNSTVVDRVMTGSSDTFTLEGRDYTLVLFKGGYGRFVGTLTGGQNASISLQPIASNMTGSLSVFVYDKDSAKALSGITVNVFDESGVTLGMGSSTTDSTGIVFLSGIPAMRVKPVAYKGGDAYRPSPETVEIKAGQTADADIPIPLKNFNLSITVLDVAGAFVQGADVYLYDYKGSQVSSARTDVRGRTSFAIVESKKYYAAAERYDNETKVQYRTTSETFTVVSSMNKTITLRPVEANVSFLGFYNDPALQSPVTAGNILTAGNSYYAAFAVGLPDLYNETVFQADSDDAYLMFLPYGDIVVGNPRVENTSRQIRITWKNFTYDTATIKARVYAKAAVNNTGLNYSGNWKRGDKTAAKEGKAVLNITSANSKIDCVTKDGICFDRSMSKRDLSLQEDFTVKFTMRYEGYQLKDMFQIEGTKHVKFTGITLSKNYAYQLGEREINITGIVNNISAGDVLEGNITAKAIIVGKNTDTGGNKPQIDFRVGTTSFPIDFNVTGKYSVSVSASPTKMKCKDSSVSVTVNATYEGKGYKGVKAKSGDHEATTGDDGKATITVDRDSPSITLSSDDADVDPPSISIGITDCPGELTIDDKSLTKASPPTLEFNETGVQKCIRVFVGSRDEADVTIHGARVTANQPIGFDKPTVSPETLPDIKPGSLEEAQVCTKANELGRSGNLDIKLIYTYPTITRTVTVSAVATTVTPPTQPPTLTAPSAAGRVLDEQTFRANIGTAGSLTAMMASNYTGTRHALEAVYRVLNFTDHTITDTNTDVKTWVVLNVARVGGIGSTDLLNFLCAKRGKQVSNPSETATYCGSLVATSAVSGKALVCGRYNVSLEVDRAGSTTGDYVWKATGIQTLSSKCAFENVSQFAGFLDNVNVSSDSLGDADRAVLATEAKDLVSSVWGFTNCNLKRPLLDPIDNDKCAVSPSVRFVSPGNYLILKNCTGDSSTAATNCRITETGNPASVLQTSVNWTEYAKSDTNAAVEVGYTEGGAQRVVVYVKKASDVPYALRTLSGYYNGTPTALVFEGTNRKVLYISGAALSIDSVDLPVAVQTGAKFNISMVYSSGRGYNGTVWVFWNDTNADYAGNSTFGGTLISSARGTKDGFEYFSATVTNGTKVTVTLNITKDGDQEIRYRAAEDRREIGCGTGTDSLRYPAEGICKKECTDELASCAYKSGTVKAAPAVVPTGATLVQLLQRLNELCQYSIDKQNSEYGSTFFRNQGMPIVLQGPFTFSAAPLYYVDASGKCITDRPALWNGMCYMDMDATGKTACSPLDELDAGKWNALRGGICYTDAGGETACSPVYSSLSSDLKCTGQINFVDSAADWEYGGSIKKDTAYQNLAVHWYEPTLIVRECAVREVKRPSVAYTKADTPAGTITNASQPISVKKGDSFRIYLRYTAGFQSNGVIYVYFDYSKIGLSPTIELPTGATSGTVSGDLRVITVPLASVKAGGTREVELTFIASNAGDTVIRYRAKDDVPIKCAPVNLGAPMPAVDVKGKDYDVLRSPASGECTDNCRNENADCDFAQIVVPVHTEDH